MRKEIMSVVFLTEPEPVVFRRYKGKTWQGCGVWFECGNTRDEIITACQDAAESLHIDIPPYTKVKVV